MLHIPSHEISTISSFAQKDIYAHRQGRLSFPKDLWVYTAMKRIVTANDADHSRTRTFLSHALSEKALREQEGILQMHVDELVSGPKR